MTHTAKARVEPPTPSTSQARSPQVVSPIGIGIQGDPLPWHSAASWSVLALVLADLAALVIARELVLLARSFVFGRMPMSPAFIAASLLWLSMRLIAGLYPGYGISQPDELKRSTITIALAALCHLSLLFAIQETGASRFLAVGVWLLLVPAAWSLRNAVKQLLVRWRVYGHPVIVLGAGKTGHWAIREFLNNPGLGVIPVAVFDDDPSRHGERVHGVPILGALSAARTWQPPYPVRHAMVAMSSASALRVVALAQELAHRYRNVGVVADLVGVGNLWTRAKTVGTCSVVEMRHDRFDRVNLVLKRIFDLALGVPLFVASIPIILLSATAVRLVSPGASAFYTQSRMGLGGRRIRMWKIRTMVPNADQALNEYLQGDNDAKEQWERHMKLRDDPRIIPILGRFLRKTSLDELPQLWNVVTGEMSLVGPRPFPDYHLSKFSEDFRDLRMQVPPGITGYWQVTYRSTSNIEQQQVADTYYIYNWSLWLDLWIMFRTMTVVVTGKGAY